MPVKKRGRSAYQQRLARERIKRLFGLAEKEFAKAPELSDRYVRLAWRISLKYGTRFPAELKRRFCRKCLSYLVPGKTCSVRVGREGVVITCLHCRSRARYPVKRGKVLK